MNDNGTEAELELHRRQVAAVMTAVAKLLPKLAGRGFTPEAILEGAVKGGAVQLLAAHPDLSATDIAELLDDLALAFRDDNAPDLHVVN